MKDTQSIRVKWYFKLFSKLDNEQTNVDMTTRAFAYIIDWVLGSFVTAFPTVFMYMSYTKSTELNQNLLTFPTITYALIAGGLSLLFAMIYYVYIPVKVHKGQTYGKKFMDVKVVKLDGSDVDFKTMLKREVLGRFLLEASLVAVGNYIFLPLKCVSSVLCIISILIALKTDSRRMIHDYVGKTKIISTKEQ